MSTSITDFASLQTSIANWLHRTDLTALIPDFIALAEARMNGDIRSRSMETKTSLAVTSGNNIVATPSDMLEMRRIQVIGSPNTVLDYRSPDEIASDYQTGQTGTPQVFTVIGANLELQPIPDAAYTLELSYIQRIPSLSASNTTNWLLTNWPNVYLFGALIQAQPYMINDPRIATFEKFYQDGVNAINSIDWYSGSTMQVKAR
ncbi:MAG: hypothetical protein KGL39_23660 [Patescibacteria group bacterium]|nr:hypothetical protein [Patescibacteria group bacterium]